MYSGSLKTGKPSNPWLLTLPSQNVAGHCSKSFVSSSFVKHSFAFKEFSCNEELKTEIYFSRVVGTFLSFKKPISIKNGQ